MWLTRILASALILTGMALAYFAIDILAWTFGASWLPPLDALVRFGIWCVPFSLCLFFTLTPAQRRSILMRGGKKK